MRFADGAILNAYSSGRITWQGKDTATRARVDRLLASICLVQTGMSAHATPAPAPAAASRTLRMLPTRRRAGAVRLNRVARRPVLDQALMKLPRDIGLAARGEV